MSCRFTTDELVQRKYGLEDEIDALRQDLADGVTVSADNDEALLEDKREELDTVERILDTRDVEVPA